jgi:hypothetical protein
MKAAPFRLFGMISMGLYLILDFLKLTITGHPLFFQIYYLLIVILVITIGYFYLMVKGRLYFITESGRKPIRLFGSPKLMGVFLITSLIYLSVLIFLNHLNGFSYFSYTIGYLIFSTLVMILNYAYDDKMLIGQQQY